ncbi:MAG: toprim domain-containing protein [Alphaproteobacteria bacterium]|nr:toprim domain-containing protein [Alphaproteobacteria bacterium]
MTPLPGFSAWQARAGTLGLKRSGRELVGPCPVCGGRDRFRVTRTGGAFCRHCCPDGRDTAALRRLIEAAGFAWPAPENAGERRKGAHGTAATTRRQAANGPQGRPGGVSGGGGRLPPDARRAKIARAHRVWGEVVPDPGPVCAYLAARGCWPPDVPLPDSVRWLPRSGLDAQRWREGPPGDAAGAMACCYTADGIVTAVSLEALRTDGTRCVPRWQRTVGERSGAAFRVPGPVAPENALALAEGEADALSIRTWTGCEAWCGGGTAGLASLAPALVADGRPVTVYSDGDGAGRTAAAALQDHALALLRDVPVRVVFSPAGFDPGATLTETWAERVAILEAEGGLARAEAEHAAWAHLKADLFCAPPAVIPKPAREA